MNMPILKTGDKIGIIATARKVSEKELESCVSLLTSWGLEVIFSPNLFKTNNQFAGTDTERASDLQWAVNHTELKAVIVARGGYGTSKIIDFVDFTSFKSYPKWFIGFSDVTVLLNQLHNNNAKSIHGPVGLLLDQNGGQESAERLNSILFNSNLKEIRTSPHVLDKIGEIKGELIGGNLSIIHTLISTNSDLDTKGKILFIEDLDEYLYHIDRMMVHLDRADKFKDLAGLVVGHMSDMNDNKIPFGKTAYEIIHEHCTKYHFPIAFGMPIGHESNNHPVIVGGEYKLTVESNSGSILQHLK